MSTTKNFLHRALDAIIEGRAREAQRYVDRYQRQHPASLNGKLMKR